MLQDGLQGPEAVHTVFTGGEIPHHPDRPMTLTTYQRETLTALYASLDYLTCNDLPGQAEIQAAIQAIETLAN